MGRLIVSAQMTMDSVMDHMEGWFDPEGESEQHGIEELRAADALILGRRARESDPEIRCFTDDHRAVDLEFASTQS
jgi:hypothetical protein